MAQEAAPEEIANAKLRRLLARNPSFECAEALVGDSALFFKTVSRKSATRWRGPAVISEIDEAGVTVKFRRLTFKVARNCVRRKAEPKNVGGVEKQAAFAV